MKKGIDTIGVFVSVILHDGEGNILMARRAGYARDNHGHWDFGGGSVEHGELFDFAIIREITEEYGTVPYDLKLVDTREFIDENGHWVGIFFVGKIDREKVYIAEPCMISWTGSPRHTARTNDARRQRVHRRVRKTILI